MDNYFGKLGNDQIEALQKAEPIVSGILKAQDEGDYDGFCSFFEGALKQNITKEDFLNNQQNILKTMGKLHSKKFLCSLKRDGLIGLVYKARFDRNDDDFMVTITLNDKSDPVMATGIWIS